MRIVLDTNVLISAEIADGPAHQFVAWCLDEHYIVISEFIFQEFTRVLTKKFKVDPTIVEEAVLFFRKKMHVVPLMFPVSGVCSDPDDDNILATALAGSCSHIVTGDRQLLILKEYRSISIVSVQAFKEISA